MNPQSATVGARLGRRLNGLITAAAQPAPDPVAFLGGLLASIIGCAAGMVGPQTAAQLVRISLERLDGTPALELPPGVRLAIAAAQDEPAAPEHGDLVNALNGAFAEQLASMQRVLAIVSAKADISSDKLVELLDAALQDIRAGRPPRPL